MERQWKPSERSLPFLALGSLGAQSVWSTEMAFAGPFLLHLGMTKSNMAFVFVAGPLSGLLCQPIVGSLTDNSTSKWGRRRPALAIACILCAMSMLLLGFARPLASLFTSTDSSQTSLTIAIVVFSIFAIDFSVNAINVLDRTLILDLVQSKHQSLANVWSARLSGIGAILGFFIGQNDLTRLAPFTWMPSIFASDKLDSSEAQLRCVCVLVVFLLFSTHAVTLTVAKESPASGHLSDRSQAQQSQWQLVLSSLVMAWTDLVKAARTLSRPIVEVFRVHFFLSMAWYPVLFYGTSWVSDIARSRTPSMDPAAAMRLGSLAMLFHATFSFACTLVLPLLLQLYKRRVPQRSMDTLTALWSISILTLALILMSTWIAERLDSTSWAMVTLGLTGFAWCLNVWAPYALLGILIQKGIEAKPRGSPLESISPLPGDGYISASTDIRDCEEGEPLMQRSPSERDHEDYEADYEDRPDSRARRGKVDPSNQSGTITGLHNVCIVLPQFLMTALSSVIFLVVQSKDGKDTNASNFGLVLRLGGLSALVSSYYALRLARQHSKALEG